MKLKMIYHSKGGMYMSDIRIFGYHYEEFVELLKKDGILLINNHKINSMVTLNGKVEYPKNIAEELAPKIHVNCIAPGWVDTDINKKLPKDFVKEETKRNRHNNQFSIHSKKFPIPVRSYGISSIKDCVNYINFIHLINHLN